MKDLLTAPDEQIMAEAKALRIGYGLKRTLRFGTSRNLEVHSESVAEHVFALIYLAQYFVEHEKVQRPLDRAKLYELLLFHDFGEIKNGDISYHLKTAQHEEQEKKDALEIFASLPEPVNSKSLERWHEYENQDTLEAHFAYALDKIEPVFELLDPVNEQSMKRMKFSYKMHYGKKFVATKNFPVMRRFAEVLSQDMLKRQVFWDEESV